uniref:Uncharacterized protein n=1 Tax=Photinus pyralis TaxID=7054 RepID=A0A1Y1MTH4_PHOPY
MANRLPMSLQFLPRAKQIEYIIYDQFKNDVNCLRSPNLEFRRTFGYSIWYHPMSIAWKDDHLASMPRQKEALPKKTISRDEIPLMPLTLMNTIKLYLSVFLMASGGFS